MIAPACPWIWPVLLWVTTQPATVAEPPLLAAPDLSGMATAVILEVPDGEHVRVLRDGDQVTLAMAGLVADPRAASTPAASPIAIYLLQGERVWLVPASSAESAERKWYLYRWPDKLPLNLELVRQGCADVEIEPGMTPAMIRAMQFWRDRARTLGKGIWAGGRSVRAAASRPAAHSPPVKQAAHVPPSAPAEPVIVYISPSGKKYHRAECRSLRGSKTPILLDEARKSHEPCKQCDPPK